MSRPDPEIDGFDPHKLVRMIRWAEDGGVAERQDVSITEAAEMSELGEAEIAWALEEFGRCDTDEYAIWQPSENNGDRFPTHEAP